MAAPRIWLDDGPPRYEHVRGVHDGVAGLLQDPAFADVREAMRMLSQSNLIRVLMNRGRAVGGGDNGSAQVMWAQINILSGQNAGMTMRRADVFERPLHVVPAQFFNRNQNRVTVGAQSYIIQDETVGGINPAPPHILTFQQDNLAAALINNTMGPAGFHIYTSYRGSMLAPFDILRGVSAALHQIDIAVVAHAFDFWNAKDQQAYWIYLHLQLLIQDIAAHTLPLLQTLVHPNNLGQPNPPQSLLFDFGHGGIRADPRSPSPYGALHTGFQTLTSVQVADDARNIRLEKFPRETDYEEDALFDFSVFRGQPYLSQLRLARTSRFYYRWIHAFAEITNIRSGYYTAVGQSSLPEYLTRAAFQGSEQVEMLKLIVSFRYYTNPRQLFDPRTGGNISVTLRKPDTGARRLASKWDMGLDGQNTEAGYLLQFQFFPQLSNGAVMNTDVLLGGLRGQALNLQFADGVGRHSLLHIHDFGDGLCVPKALVCLLAYKARTANPSVWRQFRTAARCSEPQRKGVRRLHEAALMLASKAALNPDDFPIGMRHLDKFCAALSEGMQKPCHIQVFDVNRGMALAYATLPTGTQGVDFDSIEWFDLLLYDDHHVLPALKLHKLLSDQRHFCYRCKKTSFRKEHRCISHCSMCKSATDHYQLWQEKKDSSLWVKCNVCTRKFYTNDCYQAHLPTCNVRWKCETCNKSFFSKTKPDGTLSSWAQACDRKDHKCGEIYCNNCKQYTAAFHPCFMTATEPQQQCDKFLFADFEATQNTGRHVINLAVTIDHTGQQWPLHHTVEEWLEYLLRPQWRGYTVIFHNGKGYDFQFILNAILQRKGSQLTINPVMVGRKILYCELSVTKRFSRKTGYRFVDSLNFLPMALKKFTKTFGIKTKKGYYPHFFNTKEHLSYVGHIPDVHAFGYSDMSVAEQLKFMEWYEERKLTPWHNAQELFQYCLADVQLLREGCLTFRKLVMEATPCNHDPFQVMTLASSAVQIFRTNYLLPESVAALPTKVIRELHPCLAGGRTGCTKLYRKARPGEKMYYVDFTSAYPYVCKNGIYPLGYPEIYEREMPLELMQTGASIWKVDVLPPARQLYHPLLHSKDPESKRLLFDLRPKYAHMYTNFELLKALELGYTISKVHKVWHWPRTIQGIFKDYINIFLKIKQEAAGWPSKNMTAEEKRQYLDDYKAHEGIELDAANITDERNSGRYAVAKLYLNSLWGKFGQRLSEKFTRTELLHSTEDGLRKMYKLLEEDRIQSMEAINEYSALITTQIKEAAEYAVDGNKNIALAIFTTAHARLKLYNELLEPLGTRICYYDTDSAIFCASDEEMPELSKRVPLGPYLGDITNELGDHAYTYEGEHIVLFASGGPKNYGFVTSTSAEVAKIKGHNLKGARVQNFLNFNAITNAVLFRAMYRVDYQMIQRDKGFVLRSTPQSKIYRVCFVKRVLWTKLRDDQGQLYCIDTRPFLTGETVGEVTEETTDLCISFDKTGRTMDETALGIGITHDLQVITLPSMVDADPQSLLMWVEGLSADTCSKAFAHVLSYRNPIIGLSACCQDIIKEEATLVLVGTEHKRHFLLDNEYIQIVFLQ